MQTGSSSNSTLSSVRDQIKNMIKSMKKCPSKFMAQIYQFNSISELEIKTGISFQAGTICRFLNTLTLEANHYNTCAIIIMTNQNFTVDVDYQNQLGPFNFISDNTTLQDIKSAVNEDEVPLFISSLKYGTQVMISIQTNQSYSELEDNLHMNGLNINNIHLFMQNLTNLRDVNLDLYINGFRNQSMNQITQSNIGHMIESALTNKECFGSPIYYSLSNLSDNSTFSFPKPNVLFQGRNTITILYVILDCKFHKRIDFSFVESFRKKKLSIDIIPIKESNFISSLLSTGNYLSKIDILMFGGTDGRYDYDAFSQGAVSLINDWRMRNGFVIFLHDFIVKRQTCLFRPLINDLGYRQEKSSENFSEVSFTNNAPASLYNDPYIIPRTIKITTTHESAVYNDRYVMIKASNSNAHYYCENLSKGVADLSIGHYSELYSSNEQKLFINIIKRITTLRNHNNQQQQTPQPPADNNNSAQNVPQKRPRPREENRGESIQDNIDHQENLDVLMNVA